MSDVLLTSLLEDKKSFFQVSLTKELLSWVRVTSPDGVGGGGGGGGGWGQAQHLKQRESILACSPSAVTTDINSRRTVMTCHVLGVSTQDRSSKRPSRWARKQLSTATTSQHLSSTASSEECRPSTDASMDASTGAGGGAASTTSSTQVAGFSGAVATGKIDSNMKSNSQTNSPSIASQHAGKHQANVGKYGLVCW